MTEDRKQRKNDECYIHEMLHTVMKTCTFAYDVIMLDIELLRRDQHILYLLQELCPQGRPGNGLRGHQRMSSRVYTTGIHQPKECHAWSIWGTNSQIYKTGETATLETHDCSPYVLILAVYHHNKVYFTSSVVSHRWHFPIASRKHGQSKLCLLSYKFLYY